jgi:hypothetical protein
MTYDRPRRDIGERNVCQADVKALEKVEGL